MFGENQAHLGGLETPATLIAVSSVSVGEFPGSIQTLFKLLAGNENGFRGQGDTGV